MAKALEILQDGFGFCAHQTARTWPVPTISTFLPSQVRRFNLRTGDTIAAKSAPKDGERYLHCLKSTK